MPPTDPREIRTVTVLFSDLSGFTRMSELLDPEELTDIVDGMFRRFRPLIEARGGTVDKFIGDAVMAVFGAPVAHEDDPARAVSAGLAMQRELTLFNTERGLDLKMRVGINTGSALWGTIGGERATVTGDAVVVAQRLESTAKPGAVHVSLSTARAARKRFRFERREQVELKGRAEKLEAFDAHEGRPETMTAPVESPFAGRDAELAGLKALWEAGKGAFVVIEGEAGVGKSRLAQELRRAVRRAAPSAWVVTGRAVEGVRAPLAPLAEAMRGDPGATEAARLDEILAQVEPDAATRETFVNLIRFSLGLAAPGERLSGIGPARLEAEIRNAWSRWLVARAPALLVLEDLHVADEATLALLESLAAAPSGRPLMVVATARPGGRRPAGFKVVALTELARDAVIRLAASIVRAPLSRELEDFLVEATGGNPYYAEELTRYLLEEGLIAGEPRALAPGPMRVPSGLEGLLVARIDSLSSSHREALKGASVLGRVFWNGLLASVLEREVDEAVEEARRRDLVRAGEGSRFPADREFSFRHALLRDAAYSLLTRKDRARLHLAAAILLEQRAAAEGRVLLALAARHREAAGQPAEAAALWLKAAEGAAAEGLPVETLSLCKESARCAPAALAHFTAARALHQLGRLRESEESVRAAEAAGAEFPGAAWQIPGLRAQILERTGDYPASLACAAEAVARCTDTEDRARARLVVAVTLGSMARYDEALETLAVVEPETAALPEPARRSILGSVWIQRGTVERSRGRLVKSLACHQKALDLAQGRARKDVANVRMSMAAVLDRLGRTREALDLYREALADYRDTGNLASMAGCLNNLGAGLARQGRDEEALEVLRDAANRFRSMESPSGEANALNNQAMIMTGRREWDRAIALAREALAIRLRIGDRLGIASCHIHLGKALLGKGDIAGARVAIHESLAIRRELKDGWGIGRSLLELAGVSFAEAKNEEAIPFVREALALFRESGALYDQSNALKCLMEALEATGHPDEAAAVGKELDAVDAQIDAAAAEPGASS
ncbi:MAG: adenylate/guanylate cyclase domain-containing protein [Planctomycetota bacterium]